MNDQDKHGSERLLRLGFIACVAAMCWALICWAADDEAAYRASETASAVDAPAYGIATNISEWTVAYGTLATIEVCQPQTMTIGEGAEITISLTNGVVTLAPGLALDDASRLFWRTLEKAYGELFPRPAKTETGGPDYKAPCQLCGRQIKWVPLPCECCWPPVRMDTNCWAEVRE